jgi:hypothetical protein
MMTVAHVLDVHWLFVRRGLIVAHPFGIFVLKAVLRVQQRAMRKDDMIAVAGVVVGELPVAIEPETVGFADDDLAARVSIEPLVDRLLDRT